MPRARSKKMKMNKDEIKTKIKLPPPPSPPPQPQAENEVMDVEDENDNEKVEGDDENVQDFGPEFNPTAFQFLLDEKPEQFYEAELKLNRPFRAAQNFLENPHGAVKLFQGDTCALCAVYGPTEIRMSKELPHRAAVDVLFRPKITGTPILSQVAGWDSTTDERAVEAKLTGILESVLYLEDDLGAGFNVILHEFENDGCLFSTCVNATALALLNAGCSLRYSFAAVTILVNQDSDSFIVDPSQSQINKGFNALLTFVLSNTGHVLFTWLQGKTSSKLIRLCLRQASEACKEIFTFQNQLQLQECADFMIFKPKGNSDINIKNEDVKVKLEEMKIESEESDEEEDGDEEYEDVEDGEISSDS